MSYTGYTSSYFPPAPILDVVFVAQPDGTRTGAVAGFVDTGADASIVPLHLLDQIGARYVTEHRVRSHFGEVRKVHSYLVGVIIDDITLPGIEVVGDTVDETLIGRDVLNRLRLVLDGPRQQIQVRP